MGGRLHFVPIKMPDPPEPLPSFRSFQCFKRLAGCLLGLAVSFHIPVTTWSFSGSDVFGRSIGQQVSKKIWNKNSSNMAILRLWPFWGGNTTLLEVGKVTSNHGIKRSRRLNRLELLLFCANQILVLESTGWILPIYHPGSLKLKTASMSTWWTEPNLCGLFQLIYPPCNFSPGFFVWNQF